MVGFARAMGENPDWEKGLATLGKDFHITRMTFKNHACCGHTFAAIDGALELKKRMNLKPEEIEQIEVATYKAGVEVAGYEKPTTPAEGRFSLKYVVATALTHGSVRLAAFERRDRTIRDARADEAHRVSLDPQLDAAFPRSARRASRSARAAGARSSCSRRASATRRAALRRAAGGQVPRARRRCSARRRRAGARAPVALSAMTLAQALFAPRAVALIGASGDAPRTPRARSAICASTAIRQDRSRSIPAQGSAGRKAFPTRRDSPAKSSTPSSWSRTWSRRSRIAAQGACRWRASSATALPMRAPRA
jgi:hypothetical protein